MNEHAHEENGEKTEEEKQVMEAFETNLQNRLQEKRKALGLEPHETLSVEDIRLAHVEEMKVLRGVKGSKFFVKTQEQSEKDFWAANPRRASFFY